MRRLIRRLLAWLRPAPVVEPEVSARAISEFDATLRAALRRIEGPFTGSAR